MQPVPFHFGGDRNASSTPTGPAPTVLNTRPLKVNNSGFDLSPVDIVFFNEPKKGKAELMKAFRKREIVEDKT